jgi:hypothetical protein
MLLIALLLMVMLTRARPWIKANIQGKVIKTVRLSFVQRFRIHQSSLLALAMGILLGQAMGWLPVPLAIFAGVFALIILFFPMQYTFTTRGVGVGQAIFRPWTDFTGIVDRKNQVILNHSSRLGRLTLFIKPSEFAPVMAVVSNALSQ